MSEMFGSRKSHEPFGHVIIQNGFDSLDRIQTKSESFDYFERQLENLLSLIPLLKDKCRAEDNREEKDQDVLLTVEEAAAFLKLSKPTIYELINSEELPCLKIGERKLKRIWKSDLIKLGQNKDQN